MTHRCPIHNCATQVPGNKLMCPMHWRMVPPDEAARVYAAWNYGRGEGTDMHLAAIAVAITAVQQRIADYND